MKKKKWQLPSARKAWPPSEARTFYRSDFARITDKKLRETISDLTKQASELTGVSAPCADPIMYDQFGGRALKLKDEIFAMEAELKIREEEKRKSKKS